ncbi:hypothetical protein GHT06_009510 [Daphnia sinensis]|uniref:Uncharacterized protein n=1 Tax=Daphnia sinensis TaxID=1820382 RepID=A0AAD5LNU8_9CRUS|nr:hypothetical protein GHT06_009510 [Daphnia sinensis]
MVLALLFSFLPSCPKAPTEPKPRNFSPEDPEALIRLADEEINTNSAYQMNSSFFHYENERMPTLHTASQIYRVAVAHEHLWHAMNNKTIRRSSIPTKPEITPAGPFSQSDIHNERVRQNGPPNSVMSQETQSPAFVERLELLEERIAESERRDSVMSQDLKRTQFEMLELRKALQASKEIIKQLEQMLGDVMLPQQSNA